MTINLDRTNSTPVSEQLAEQLRYRIARDLLKPGESLPSTRNLGEQLGISFHTVRKAYQALVQEGFLESKKGSGYVVVDRQPIDSEDRVARAGAILEAAIQQILSLGYDEAEVEDLVREQLELLSISQSSYRIALAAPTTEIAEQLREGFRPVTGARLDVATLTELGGFSDLDYALVPFENVRTAIDASPSADVRGFGASLGSAALEKVSRLLDHHTVSLVARQVGTLAPLSARLRRETSFGGQIIGTLVDSLASGSADVFAESDLVLFTPQCKRRLHKHLRDTNHAPLAYELSEAEARRLLSTLPL
jgi:GntR family transcriptional regulator